MMAFVSQWSHALAAILFGALALWHARKAAGDPQRRALVAAALLTAFWGLAVAVRGNLALVSMLAEHCRNLGWLTYMYTLWSQGTGHERGRAVKLLYLATAVVLFCGTIGDAVSHGFDGRAAPGDASFFVLTILRVLAPIASLMLVHNLYTAASPSARAALRIPMVALAAMWCYDLNLYTIGYLTRSWPTELLQLRGLAMVFIAPVIALATHRGHHIEVRLSRTVTFRSLSLVAIGIYLAVMIGISSALLAIGGEYGRLAQVGFVFLASVSGLLLLPSAKFRAWFRVKILKHFFRHRYDYRVEWMRFTETLGKPGDSETHLDSRVVKAIADITESPAGLLLVPVEGGSLVPQARWNWDSLSLPAQAQIDDASQLFGETGRVVELDSERDALGASGVLPDWLVQAADAWAIVPLLHFGKLSGAVVLSRPILTRSLDWEDFDLLRVVGRQGASYLAEARVQEALSEARRFDEFNRRFAFIMHDIKNLVSQLSLVTRNAEKHADNPEFRADMIATLQSSTARMNDLLARLSQHNKGKAEDPRALRVMDMLERLAQTYRPRHAVKTSGDADLTLLADPVRLEQALGHLVLNAVEASPQDCPVTLSAAWRNGEVQISVADQGVGMSSNFIREKLFRPFTSTKEGGFGIGAFEARSLVAGMGGRLEVASREGEGTCFTISLPAGGQISSHTSLPEAKAA